MPSTATTSSRRVWRRQGPPPPSTPEALRALQDRLTKPDPDRARSALHSISADMDRESWVKIAMAAQAAGLTFDDFDRWSATAPDRYDPRACRDTWKSFKGSGIGPGTLFHAARAQGWNDNRRPASMDTRPTAPPRPPAPHPGAAAVWDRCTPAPAEHPYIVAKRGIPDGLRIVPDGDPLTIAGQRMAGALAVPAYAPEGHLQSIQFIPGTGRKLNLAGASMGGAAFCLGAIQPDRPAYLVEGIGQAWACHRATGEAAVCCFGWGNVATVARALAPAGPGLVLVPDVGKEGQAAVLARELGIAAAYLPDGEPANFDCNDLAQRDGIETLAELLAHVAPPEPDRTRPPPAASLIPTEEELSAARLCPRIIVQDHSYADVAVLTAPGGVGKTTLLIHEAVHIALGWPVWGLPVLSPGWTLFVTAEDRREQFLARLREIMAGLELSPEERRQAREGVRVWDVTGEGVRLVRASDGNVLMTELADEIVDRYQADPPAVVVFDPLVSFGASEGMVNDNEQGIITAARRIVKGLACCCRLIHHVGKANARAASLDQYSARGGSALPDGSRMTTVLQTWRPGEGSSLHPPPGCLPGPEASITVMARAKLSYAPPNLPLIWVRRTGFSFESFTEAPKAAPETLAAVHAEQLLRFLESELCQERHHTQTTLETMADKVGMNRVSIRRALAELRVAGRVSEAPLPPELRQGGRKTYLMVRPNPAETVGGVDLQFGPETDPTPPPSTTPPPYRDGTPGGVAPGGSHPISLNPAESGWRGTAGLAGYTVSMGIIPAESDLAEVEI